MALADLYDSEIKGRVLERDTFHPRVGMYTTRWKVLGFQTRLVTGREVATVNLERRDSHSRQEPAGSRRWLARSAFRRRLSDGYYHRICDA